MQPDSTDKVFNYLHCVSKETLTYKGQIYPPKPLYVSPQIFHEFGCVANCGGCCSRFSLDYLPTEAQPENEVLQEKAVSINDTTIILNSIHQYYVAKEKCKFLNTEGRCNIHKNHPMSCDIAPLQFVNRKDSNWVGVKPYGRRWNMLIMDGSRGALCEFSKNATEEARVDAIRKFKRIQQWADAFGIQTNIDLILDYASMIRTEPLIISVPHDSNLETIF